MQSGVKHKRIWGIKRRIKAPDFHTKFGTSTETGDFNLDPGISNPNQENPNLQWGCPAYPEGCTYYTQTEVNQDADKILYSPVYQGTWACSLENEPMGSPCDMATALNVPASNGLQAMGETTIAQAQTHLKAAYSVKPINGSLFQGVVSAMRQGQGSVSFAGTWYQSFLSPIGGIVEAPSGGTSDHNWKICGVKSFNGIPYVICKPWLGGNWGDKGFCYMSEYVLNQLDGEAFIFMPATASNPVVHESILEALIHYLLQELGIQEGSTIPIPYLDIFETKV